jgi:hypothetical protein
VFEVSQTNTTAASLKGVQLADYDDATHRIGRIWCSIAIALMISLPLSACIYFNVWPPLGGLLKGILSVCLIYLPVGIIEVLTYAPMIGPTSTYLVFVTGNLSNLKIPCAYNSMSITGTKPGSPEGEVISTLSVAVSSIVTTLLIVCGVLLIIPLQPVILNPVLKPAFDNVIPALCGALGVTWMMKSWKLAIMPSVAMLILFIFVPVSMLGIMIPVAALIAMLAGRIMYKKGIL